MRHARHQNFCKFAAVAAIIWLGFLPREAAAARICPRFLARYCVVNAAGKRETIWTNPCFAREAHLRILYPGHCRRRHYRD